VKLRTLALDLRVNGSKTLPLLDFPSRNQTEVGNPQNELQGYSKTNAGMTKQSRYYYNKKEKEKERERKELQQRYGDICSLIL
jgi:hypothetical protein